MIKELINLVSSSKKVLFVGIGNVLKKDDGIGVYISNSIINRDNVSKLTVEVCIENYIGKINSLNPDILVLIDCVDLNKPPGTVSLLPIDKIQDFTFNTHNISLKKVTELFNMPVMILGIQPESVDFGESFSYLVFEAAKRLIQLINNKEDPNMAKDYLCPICKGHLRVENALVVSAKSKTNKKGLVFLNPEIGDYTTTTHPDFHLEEGEEYTVYCPICHATINREENKNLVKVFMVDEDGSEFEIFFSGIVGEKCTYKIKDKEIEEIGPDAKLYRDYIVPEEYQEYLKR